MAALPPLTSTTLEGAFLELAFLLQSAEVNINNKGIAAANFINITSDSDTESVNVTATMPIFFGSSGRGGSVAAAEYMASDYVNFTTGK